MALDESLVRHAAVNGPVLRLYAWSAPTLSIGYAQDSSDVAGAVEGLALVRRITGGRAVLHDKEATWSISVPSGNHLFSGGPLDGYRAVSAAIAEALNDIGVPAEVTRGEASSGPSRAACFAAASRCEVAVNGAKIAGAAQRRFRDAVLLHGSVLFDVDESLSAAVFGRAALEKTAWASAWSSAGVEEFRAALVCRMAGRLGAEFTHVLATRAELEAAAGLTLKRYSSDSWNLGGVRAYGRTGALSAGERAGGGLFEGGGDGA